LLFSIRPALFSPRAAEKTPVLSAKAQKTPCRFYPGGALQLVEKTEGSFFDGASRRAFSQRENAEA